MASTWDLVIRGGTLIDPAQGLSVRRDVAFRGGRVAEVGERLAGEAAETVDAAGALVMPGLIDLHAHVYHGVAGLHADRASLAHGVTTVVDAGSAGWRTFGAFRDYVIPTYRSRVLAFVHLSATGLVMNRIVPELADMRFAEVEEAARAAKENAGLVIGVKVRIANGATGTGDTANAREALRRARQAADLAGGRLMVHVSDTPIPLPEILDHLRSGDIATHAFNGNAERIIGADGRVRPEVRAWGETRDTQGYLLPKLALVLVGMLAGAFLPQHMPELFDYNRVRSALAKSLLFGMLPVVGIQWFVLRRDPAIARAWIILVPLAWIIGAAAGFRYGDYFAGYTGGALMGGLAGLLLVLRSFLSRKR